MNNRQHQETVRFTGRTRSLRISREDTPPTRTLTASARPVPEQISALRNSHPQSVALSYVDRQLSYGELDRRADRFAGHLAQCGVVSGGTVAICMERSFDWI